MKCHAKRGFFTLYDCGKDAQKQCSHCQRFLCHEHFPREQEICLECQAQRTSAKNSSDLIVSTYRERHDLMSSASYKPIYYGTDLIKYYSAYDARAFDVELSSLTEVQDSPDELYYDS